MRVLAIVTASVLLGPGTVAAQEDRSQWAPSVSFLAGKFDTDRLSSTLREWTDHEAHLAGRSWDIGVARGRPGRSYFRVAYTEVRVDDGSWAFGSDARHVTEAIKIRGVKFERLFRLGPSRWPVAPMISLHGGIGKLSGRVRTTHLDYVWNPALQRFEERIASISVAEASDLLNPWMPIAGAGVGLSGNIRDYLTLTVSVFGIELPGLYHGSVQMVYWPRRFR